jgi:hypothetical protein
MSSTTRTYLGLDLECPVFSDFSHIWIVSIYFLALFAKLWKATVSIVMSIRLSAWNSWVSTGRIFMKFCIWVFFGKSIEKIQGSLKSDKNSGYFTWRPIQSGSLLLRMRMFQTKVVERIKTHILCSITFFRKSCRLWDNVEKCCRTGQATDGSMAHAHFTQGT